jgi:YVTN family beta-propeller protein
MLTFRFVSIALALQFLVACTRTRPDGGDSTAPRTAGSTRLPGQQADGSVLLHNQWSLRPAGRQIELADFPVNIALHPGGRFAAVLHAGYSRHQVLVVDLQTATVVSRAPINITFYGIAFAHDGKRLYCSGAGDESVHAFDFTDGQLSNSGQIRLRDAKQRAVVSGLAVNRAGDRLYAANVWGHRLTTVDLTGDPKPTDIPLGTNISALSSAPVAPSAQFEEAAATKRAEAALYPSDPADTFPYACLLDEDRKRLYVTLWAQAKVAVLDLNSDQVQALWSAEDHPCEMALSPKGAYLFVANANRNTVTIFETATGRPIETIWAALYPKSPPGSTPNSVALTPDGTTLFVANADNNAVAVFDVSTPGKSRPMGFIPVGWYPTSVRVTLDGKRLLVANGRGTTPKANPLGPQPGLSSKGTAQYIGSLYAGTLSVIDIANRKDFEKQLAAYTAQAYKCSPLKSNAGVTSSKPSGNPVPSRPGDKTPIKYCIYIIKENRTYDQVLGDMPEGNGDPNLCLFPERVTPNHHKLAREFVLLDNFYVNSEVSADGHEWSMGAYATDFVKKMWPLSYGHNASGKFPYPSEGNFPIASPAGGYLWDRARAAGVSYRSYGEFVSNGRTPEEPARCRLKSLEGHFDEWFRSFDMAYPDRKRAERYIAELKRFEKEGDMPRLQIVRLPNDHTHGTSPNVLTPTALVADNDVALGMVIEAITHSRFWPQTAVFVLEDDAQNGPDHVDAHRSPAFVISPYSRRGVVDSTMYATTSMLRTMELILGLQPMTQFDAAATPMFNCFQSTPNLAPYKALPANVDLDERNRATAWGGNFEMDFATEDAADDLMLNEVIWRAIRGEHSPMPAPVRAAFVFPRAGDADDDE